MTTKKAIILQSNYIPWKGYFDMIAMADELVIFDEAQYTKNDWRNRNQIKTPKGLEWLTIPAGKSISRRINEVRINSNQWQVKHWKTLEANYARSEFFHDVSKIIKPMYFDKKYDYLSNLNLTFIKTICSYLKIDTRITNTTDYNLLPHKTERLVNICEQLNCDEYISGPAAQSYIEPEKFSDKKIKLTWYDYSGYPTYPQLWGEFKHGVSILDLLFNCGQNAYKFMKHVPEPC